MAVSVFLFFLNDVVSLLSLHWLWSTLSLSMYNVSRPGSLEWLSLRSVGASFWILSSVFFCYSCAILYPARFSGMMERVTVISIESCFYHSCEWQLNCEYDLFCSVVIGSFVCFLSFCGACVYKNKVNDLYIFLSYNVLTHKYGILQGAFRQINMFNTRFALWFLQTNYSKRERIVSFWN